MTNPLQHIADLLADHDGDDRCGCLNETVWQLAAEGNTDQQLHTTISRLGNCLANHPAGLTIRQRIPDTPAGATR